MSQQLCVVGAGAVAAMSRTFMFALAGTPQSFSPSRGPLSYLSVTHIEWKAISIDFHRHKHFIWQGQWTLSAAPGFLLLKLVVEPGMLPSKACKPMQGSIRKLTQKLEGLQALSLPFEVECVRRGQNVTIEGAIPF